MINSARRSLFVSGNGLTPSGIDKASHIFRFFSNNISALFNRNWMRKTTNFVCFCIAPLFQLFDVFRQQFVKRGGANLGQKHLRTSQQCCNLDSDHTLVMCAPRRRWTPLQLMQMKIPIFTAHYKTHNNTWQNTNTHYDRTTLTQSGYHAVQSAHFEFSGKRINASTTGYSDV